MSKNVDYDTIRTSIVIGDTFDQTFLVTLNEVPFDMTGKQLDISLRNVFDTKAWSSGGALPAITISGTTFTIFDAAWNPSKGHYKGWLRNTTDDYVLAYVIINIEK